MKVEQPIKAEFMDKVHRLFGASPDTCPAYNALIMMVHEESKVSFIIMRYRTGRTMKITRRAPQTERSIDVRLAKEKNDHYKHYFTAEDVCERDIISYKRVSRKKVMGHNVPRYKRHYRNP